MSVYAISKDRMNFFNIIPNTYGKEELAAADALEYVERTGNEAVLYCLTLHPEGYPAMKKVEQYIGSYRKFKAALEGTKAKPGILLQSILGHWPRVDKDEEDWTRTVNCRGEKVRYCPLDENFRKYIYDIAVMCAKEEPCLILTDDDVRAFSPHAECFCPLHTKEFSRLMGREYTQEEYIKAVNESEAGDKVSEVFIKLQREMVNGVVSIVREAVNSVDPSIPAGTCMPWNEYLFNGQAAKCIAADGQPYMLRLCNADYLEDSLHIFPEVVVRTQSMRNLHSDIPIVLDESDTFPHSLYSRSATSMHTKLVSSIMNGINGAKLWLVNCHKNGYPVNRRYTDIIAENSKLYEELVRTVNSSVQTGIAVPADNKCSGWHPVKNNFQHMIPMNSWAGAVFGVFGIPFNVTYDFSRDQVYAIAGSELIERFSDDQLKELFSRRLLLDGPAAAAASARGFSEYMGVSADMCDFRFNLEKNTADGQEYSISKDNKVPYLKVTDENVYVMTELGYRPYASSPDFERVSPATVFFRNKLGGYVCTVCYHPEMYLSRYNEPRKNLIIEILEKLSGGKMPPVVLNEQNYLVLSRACSNGDTLVYAANYCFDRDDDLRVKYSGTVSKILKLESSGGWKDIPFTFNDGVITIDEQLMCYGNTVFRIC